MANLSNKFGVSPISFIAETAVTKNRLVKLGAAADTVIPCSAITDLAIGVAETTAAVGESVPVQMFGVAQVMVGAAAVAKNAQVMPEAVDGGKILTAAGATAKSCGVALEAGDPGETIAVLLAVPNVNGVANA